MFLFRACMAKAWPLLWRMAGVAVSGFLIAYAFVGDDIRMRLSEFGDRCFKRAAVSASARRLEESHRQLDRALVSFQSVVALRERFREQVALLETHYDATTETAARERAEQTLRLARSQLLEIDTDLAQHARALRVRFTEQQCREALLAGREARDETESLTRSTRDQSQADR